MAITISGTPGAAAANTITIPTHRPNDIIVIFAYRDGSTTIPTQPASSGTIPSWQIINSDSGGNTNSSRCSYARATASNHTSGTWTNATGLIAIVLRGVDLGNPVGGQAQAGTVGNDTTTVPQITPINLSGSSMFLSFVGHRTVSAWSTAPAGYTRRAAVATEVCCNTKDDTTTDGSVVQLCTSTNSGYRAIQVEFLAAVPRYPACNHSNPGFI
jgi:hypothetical protein